MKELTNRLAVTKQLVKAAPMDKFIYSVASNRITRNMYIITPSTHTGDYHQRAANAMNLFTLLNALNKSCNKVKARYTYDHDTQSIDISQYKIFPLKAIDKY